MYRRYAHQRRHGYSVVGTRMPPVKYDYDLIVIGGGSGGLATAKEAADLGKKVACLDFVHPSPQGSQWGLGGTCVNVGCIPKKLMHQAALLGHSLDDARIFGWDVSKEVKHSWATLRDNIQDYIGSLNWKYRVQLRTKDVTYLNAYGELIDPHTVKHTNRRGESETITSQDVILATGMRPRYPDIPGASEYAISSDDLFSLPYEPGKVLVVGASYVSLECAGFLAGLGYDVTVMVRSILLRGFDQQMAEMIGEHMKSQGIKFIRSCIPTKIERLEEGEPGRYKVTAIMQSTQSQVVGEYNTVMMAIGRNPCTKELGVDATGIKCCKSGYVFVNDKDQTNISNIYAIGDIAKDRPELTPVAIKSGRLLVHRLYGNNSTLMDYVNVPTTVFTPLEYGAIGYSEEAAIDKYGENDVEVYHTHFWPLEWTVPGKENNICYAKLISVKSLKERVVGFHVLGPNAGELTQGFTVGMKMGATKEQYDLCVGIHPTCAETFTNIQVTKSSGEPVGQAGC